MNFAEGNKTQKKEEKGDKNSSSHLLKDIGQLTVFKFSDDYNFYSKSINSNTFYIDALPDNNQFGEVPLYSAPPGYILRNKKVELSGAIFSTGVTVLNYLGYIFPGYYLFPYLCLTAIISWSRYFMLDRLRQIYQISIINENKLRVTYLLGGSEEVEMRNFYIKPSMLESLKAYEGKNDKAIQNKPFLLNIMVNNKSCGLTFRDTWSSLTTNQGAHLSLTNLPLLYGILNKQTRKLALTEKTTG